MNGNNSRFTLSASALKTIALITMFIDHLGLTVVYELEQRYVPGVGPYGRIAMYMRMVGRIAFIIYAFLLVEGFVNTSDRRKYLLRLIAGAVISEIPFDLAGSHTWLDPWDQNIFFTLAIGFCTIWALEILRERRRTSIDKTDSRNTTDGLKAADGRKNRDDLKAVNNRKVWYILLEIAVVADGLLLAEQIRCDYGCMGVGLIVVFYLFRWREGLFWAALAEAFIGHLAVDMIYYFIDLYRYSKRWGTAFRNPGAAGIIVNLLGSAEYRIVNTMPGIIVALLLILCYNGTKGRQLPKAFYYLFYPVHLTGLFIVMKILNLY